MANIFDYIQWRDIEIDKVEFNEIDSLILSRLSYFPLDDLVKENEELTLKEVYERYKIWGTTGKFLQKEDIELLPTLANTKRFGNIKMSNYINKIDSVQEKQFCAMTFFLPDETIYVAYRGTDDTLVGWKEDFNMSFSELVPSQTDAVKYLNEIGEKYQNKIRVGGHSKGGNLAVYASAFCYKVIQRRIINIYNNDGPGFSDNVINSVEYKTIIDKVNTYIPQTSIVGRLLKHEGKTKILKSTQTFILQHDIYSWQVMGDKFIEEKQSDSGEFIDKTITEWLKEVSPEQREEFFEILYEILKATNVESFLDIGSNWFSSAKAMLKTYKNLEPESKEIMTKTLSALFQIAKSNFKLKTFIKK